MRLITYLLRRRQGYTPAASVTLSGGAAAGDKVVGWLALIVCVWLLTDTASGMVNDYLDKHAAKAAESQRKRADKAEILLTTALNGGAIVVNKTKAVFFDKAKEVQL